MNAINIILDEHRSLAAVLHGMLYLVREIRSGRLTPDFKLLGAMVYYIEAFPERYHHPKEDGYLFRLLRLRNPAAGVTLDRLHEEHRAGEVRIRELAQALRAYEYGGADKFAPFAASNWMTSGWFCSAAHIKAVVSRRFSLASISAP